MVEEQALMQKRIDALPKLLSTLQKFFMKKEQECGPLRNLQSRATAETSGHIDQIVQGILEIYNRYDILPRDEQKKQKMRIHPKNDRPIITSFQVMLMNTNFYSHTRLAEDTLHGHQVGLWPVMSPYLFIQIVWSLHCEKLLPRFVLYLPLELSIEILTATIPRLAELEFKRAMNLVIQLANYMYKLIYRLSVTGTQIDPYEEHMLQLQANFQELLDQLQNPRLTQLPDLSEQMRYERQGIILKNIIRMNKLCVTEKMRGNVDEDSEKLYILTFGNESCMQLPSEFLKSFIDEMDQSLSLLLVKHLKEVTCHMYLAWAEAKDPDNPLLSLQRAIITECIYFLKAAETEAKLWENQELLMCLDQLIGSQTRPQLTLEEIYHGVESGNLTDLKELLHYYPDWNETTLQFIKTKHHMLQNKDFEVLFKYLKYEFQLRRYTQRVYLMQQATIIEMLLQRNVKDIYDITLMFVVHHYRDNFLREQHNLDDFYALMENAIGLWHNPLFVKNLLVHILCSPQQILKALLHMAVDMTDRVVCSPQQLLLLRPFLCVKISEDQSLLTDLLYQLCMDPNLWELKKYTNLIIVMLSNFVTTPEDILNNVFIRYLAEQPFDHNINCILTSTCKIVDNFKLKSGVVHLCMLVVRKISNWRKCEPSKKRIQVNHVLSSLLHLLKKCVQKPHLMTVAQKRQVLDTVLPHIEPLDKATFSPLLYLVQGNVLSIIDDYARRCYAVRRKHKQARRDSKNIYSFLDNIQLQKQDFVRHMILHASDIEYQENCLNMTIKYWFFFGWINELDAFDNVTRITMEAIRVGLEYPENVPTDVFPVLLENCVQLTKMLSNKLHDKKKIKQILLKNMSLVLRSIQCPQQRITYGDLIKKLEGMVDNSSLAMFLQEVELFTTRVFEQELVNLSNQDVNENILLNQDTTEMIHSYKFICGCFSIPGTERHHRFIEKLEEMLFNEDLNLNDHPL